MKKLELKIPPVLQVIIFAGLIYLTSINFSRLEYSYHISLYLGLFLLLLGIGIAISGVLEFRLSSTTVDPRYPDKTSSLVDTGVYRFTRNPMYLGMLLSLLSIVVYFGSLISILWCLSFILYMNQFQIKPEEKMLKEIFGSDYLDYLQRVRRWI